MANASVQLKGQDKVLAHLKKLSNPNQLLDTAIKQTAANSIRKLIEGSSPSGNTKIPYYGVKNTRRQWTSPFKVSDGKYQVTNTSKSGKWNIAQLINDGHGVIRPKKKFLYIPLNRKAAMKRPGAKPDASLIMATKKNTDGDYALAKKIQPKTGTKYIDKEISRASRELTQRVIAQIRKVFN